jgi:hypothetical protein
MGRTIAAAAEEEQEEENIGSGWDSLGTGAVGFQPEERKPRPVGATLPTRTAAFRGHSIHPVQEEARFLPARTGRAGDGGESSAHPSSCAKTVQLRGALADGHTFP